MTSTTLPVRLPMTPTRAFGHIMAATNKAAYQAALGSLAPCENASILEIGFGAGALLQLALKRWPTCKVAGIDPTPAMVEMAASRRALKRAADKVTLKCAGAEDLPFAAEMFDAVVAVNSFQFWSPPERAMDEITRVMKDGAQIVLVLRAHGQHAPDWLPNPISRSGAEAEGARALMQAHGFTDTRVSIAGRDIEVVSGRKML